MSERGISEEDDARRLGELCRRIIVLLLELENAAGFRPSEINAALVICLAENMADCKSGNETALLAKTTAFLRQSLALALASRVGAAAPGERVH